MQPKTRISRPAKPLKVLHVTFDMRIGGTEQVIKNLVLSADAKQLEMSLFCIEQPLGPFAEALIEQGIQISGQHRKDGLDLSLIQALRRHIKQQQIDIVHCHQYSPYVYGVLAATGCKAKVVFTEHGRFYPDTSSWKRKLINPWLHRITAGTTAISAATKQALVEFENLPEKDIDVIYNGIQPLSVAAADIAAAKAEWGLQQDELIFGTVARLDPIKNHPLMLRAFHALLQQGVNAKLLIVGDGETRQQLTTLVDELALQNKVIFTGYQAQPKALLACMDIYLLSSLSEGTSMTLLEAMSLGKPCVVTNAGGNPEIITHQQNGLVTPNDQWQPFAQAMQTLAQNTERRTQMGQAAKTRFAAHFSASAMLKQYQSLYQRICPLNHANSQD